MRTTLILLLICRLSFVHAFSPSVKPYMTPKKERNFNFSFTLVGIDYSWYLVKKYASGQGTENLLAGYRNRITSYGIVPGLYYKSRVGIEAYYNFVSYFNKNDREFKSYLSAAHPNYSIRNSYSFGPEWTSWNFRLCYKIKLKHFEIEPKVQLGINKISEQTSNYYTLKENGSNYFIQYEIKSESTKKYTPSGHILLNLVKNINPKYAGSLRVNIGIKLEYMIMRPSYIYTTTETAYGQPPVITEYTYNHVPARVFSAGAYVAFYFKK